MERSEVGWTIPAYIRWAPALILLFVLILAGGIPKRESDTEIIEAIESERSTARRVASLETLCLLPAIVAGILVMYFAHKETGVSERLSDFFDWAPRYYWHWNPIKGLGTAAAGFIIGGGIGWLVRIAGTLILGKEALGTGDIHVMAATGCVAGWHVALIGFVLCSILALTGIILMLPFKRARAIPLVPWLSIAFLITVLFHDPIIESEMIQKVIYLFNAPGELVNAFQGL